jgi:general secretion pathway protein E
MSALTTSLIKQLRAERAEQSMILRMQARLDTDADGVRQEVGRFLGLPTYNAAALNALHPDFERLPFADAAARLVLLARDQDDASVLVVGDPFDHSLRLWTMQRLGADFRVAFAHPADLERYFTAHEAEYRTMEQVVGIEAGARSSESVLVITMATLAEDAQPVVRLVNSTLYEALRAKASDIHLETTAQGLEVKYRIDGVILHSGFAPGTDTAEQVISRIKVLADLDIGERRVPQDGRFKALITQREVDFRVSIMPSIHGEDAVLRVLDKQRGSDVAQSLTLESLGHDPQTVAMVRAVAREPYGLLLVTGPTGSGKSTTLYATLSEINTGKEKIITIEDPVEYQLTGILQIPINEKKGLTFARGLRSVLRHDPDKILVGEIRDGETAAIATQAALTGHLVLTSVHANNVFSVLDRFLHMGVEPHSFVDALIGVVAQRLIRKICPHCIEHHVADPALLEASLLSAEQVEGWTFRRGTGCAQCRQTGYLGRQAVAEVLRMNDDLKQAFVSRVPLTELKRMAITAGFVPLRQMALRLVRDGRTTLEEVNRVTFVE